MIPVPPPPPSDDRRQSRIRTLEKFAAGGFAGAAARTVVAPFDRIKMLMQTQFILFQQPPPQTVPSSSFSSSAAPASPPSSAHLNVNSDLSNSNSNSKSNCINPHHRLHAANCNLAPSKLPTATLFRQPLPFLSHSHGHTHIVALSTSPSFPLSYSPLALPKFVASFPSSASSSSSSPSVPRDKYRGLIQGLRVLVAEEGLKSLWKGNLVNVTRVVPYSATQFASYDAFKQMICNSRLESANNNDGKQSLSGFERLAAGALAGTLATTLTHPMDVIRLRLSVQSDLKGVVDSTISVWQEGGVKALFKGYSPTILSLAPFIAINFAAYDTLKNLSPSSSSVNVLLLGAAAGLFAQTICYPLDTVRRRMQLKGKVYTSTANAFTTIWKREGLKGFYRGIVPNAVKVVPNNAIRFVAYEWIKSQIGISEGKSGSSSL